MQTYTMSREDFVDLKTELVVAMDERHKTYMADIDKKNEKHIEVLDKKHRLERKKYTQRIILSMSTCIVIIAAAMGYSVDKSVEAITLSTKTEQKSDLTIKVMEAEDQSIWNQTNSNKEDISQMKQWLLDNSSIRYRGVNPQTTVSSNVKK